MINMNTHHTKLSVVKPTENFLILYEHFKLISLSLSLSIYIYIYIHTHNENFTLYYIYILYIYTHTHPSTNLKYLFIVQGGT